MRPLSATRKARRGLPELPLAQWEGTKDTLHLWAQIVGKVRMASTAPRNHWWHVPLYVDVRGLTTRRMHAENDVAFEIDFDFVDHRLVVATDRGDVESFELADGLSVADFDEKLHATLAGLEIDVPILEQPYHVPTTTPFPEDRRHSSYDRDAVERFWHVLEWTDGVLEEFAGWYCGKSSPVHLFWHGLDLAYTRFSGGRAPARPDADPVDREAYSHDVISFGFWPGDANVREPAYYSYTAPEPAGLREQPLQPSEATGRHRGAARSRSSPTTRSSRRSIRELHSYLPGERVSSRRELGRLGSVRARVFLVSQPIAAERAPRAPRTDNRKSGGMMDDTQVHGKIEQLVAEEHELWDREAAGNGTDGDRQRLRELKVALDQCWDLLRQRRALRDDGRDPDAADLRRPEVVEGYEQ